MATRWPAPPRWPSSPPSSPSGLLEQATAVGEQLRTGLSADRRVTEVRGEGLLIGLDLVADASAAVVAAALEAGFIINNPTPSAIRLAPPLVLTAEDAEELLAAWPRILDAGMGTGPVEVAR